MYKISQNGRQKKKKNYRKELILKSKYLWSSYKGEK